MDDAEQRLNELEKKMDSIRKSLEDWQRRKHDEITAENMHCVPYFDKRRLYIG